MEGDECNLLDAVAWIKGVGCFLLFFSFFGKFAFVSFYFSFFFYVSCWFKWINPLIFCEFMGM